MLGRCLAGSAYVSALIVNFDIPLQKNATNLNRLNCFVTKVGYHIETSPLTCSLNQWTGFYMIGSFVAKELNHHPEPHFLSSSGIETGRVNVKSSIMYLLLTMNKFHPLLLHLHHKLSKSFGALKNFVLRAAVICLKSNEAFVPFLKHCKVVWKAFDGDIGLNSIQNNVPILYPLKKSVF